MTHHLTQWRPLAVGVSSLLLHLSHAQAAESGTQDNATASTDPGASDGSTPPATTDASTKSVEVTDSVAPSNGGDGNEQSAEPAGATPDDSSAAGQLPATTPDSAPRSVADEAAAAGLAREEAQQSPPVPLAPEPPSSRPFELGAPAIPATTGAETKDSLRWSTAHGGPAKARMPVWGANMDIGLPDGVMAGLVARPWPYGRAHVSAGTNGVSMGLRGGLVLRMPNLVSPALSVEAGHYFDGNANRLANMFGGHDSPLAKSVGYQFVNFHVGLEIGSRRSSFFIHGGMSYVHSVLHHANDAMATNGPTDANTFVSVQSDPQVVLWLPSVKLGFILYLV